MKNRRRKTNFHLWQEWLKSTGGYTLLEILIVVAIIAILGAIAVPGWLGFLTQQELRLGQEAIQRANYTAISNAKRDKLTWQVSFRQAGEIAQYAVHPAERPPSASEWVKLSRHLVIDEDNTTFFFDKGQGLWRVQFNHWGNTNGRMGRVTIAIASRPTAKRCVIVNTLIGNHRLARDKDCQR